MNFSLIILLSLIFLTAQSKLKTYSRLLSNGVNTTVIGNASTPVITPVPAKNTTSEHISDTNSPLALPASVHPRFLARNQNEDPIVIAPPANLTGSLNDWAMPIPLSPTVHPLYPAGGRPRVPSTDIDTLPNNETLTPTRNETGNFTDIPLNNTFVPISPTLPPLAISNVPLIPVPLMMLSEDSKIIPINYWALAGNKTFIVLRNEADSYIKCENGIVSGQNLVGKITEIQTTYLWEPEIVDDNNVNFRTYDGNYLNYENYQFNCLSDTKPSESFKIDRGSYMTGGPTENNVDYLKFQRGVFYLGLENSEVKLLEQGSTNSRFVPIFNRTVADDPLPEI